MSEFNASRDHAPSDGGVREPVDIAYSADADRIVAHLLKVQKREVGRDTGHGFRSARLIAQHIGCSTTECRALLQSMADAGRILRCDYANGLFWRSANPLPWEAGSADDIERKRVKVLWAGPLTVIVQASVSGTNWRDEVWRDVKAYPEGLRDQAEAHVERENHSSAGRRRTEYHDGRHLGSCYTPPPTYRLVTLSPLSAATASPAERPVTDPGMTTNGDGQ